MPIRTPLTQFPLSIHPSKQYFTDATGRPFQMWADSPWQIMQQLPQSDVKFYLDDRAARGFNAMLMILADFPRRAGGALGIPVFTTDLDFSTPNQTYFNNARFVVDQCAARGIVCMVVPAWLGFPGAGEGWYETLVTTSAGTRRGYGQYVGNQFLTAPNVIYWNGGDRDPAIPATNDDIVLGILDVDTSKIMSADCFPESLPTTVYASAPWFSSLTMDNVYSYQQLLYQDCRARRAAGGRPWIMKESAYEGSGNDIHGQPYSAQRGRRQIWWPILGGGGYAIGIDVLWQLNSGWQSKLSSPLSVHATIANTILQQREWRRMVPDDARAVLTSGGGTDGNIDWAGAGVANDGSFGIFYVPTNRNVSIDMSKFGALVDAVWLDPTNESYAEAGRGLSNVGTRSFTHPGTNNGGDADQVLILDARMDRGHNGAWGFS